MRSFKENSFIRERMKSKAVEIVFRGFMIVNGGIRGRYDGIRFYIIHVQNLLVI